MFSVPYQVCNMKFISSGIESPFFQHSLSTLLSPFIFHFGILASLLHKPDLHDPNYIIFLFNYSVLYL